MNLKYFVSIGLLIISPFFNVWGGKKHIDCIRAIYKKASPSRDSAPDRPPSMQQAMLDKAKAGPKRLELGDCHGTGAGVPTELPKELKGLECSLLGVTPITDVPDFTGKAGKLAQEAIAQLQKWSELPSRVSSRPEDNLQEQIYQARQRSNALSDSDPWKPKIAAELTKVEAYLKNFNSDKQKAESSYQAPPKLLPTEIPTPTKGIISSVGTAVLTTIASTPDSMGSYTMAASSHTMPSLSKKTKTWLAKKQAIEIARQTQRQESLYRCRTIAAEHAADGIIGLGSAIRDIYHCITKPTITEHEAPLPTVCGTDADLNKPQRQHEEDMPAPRAKDPEVPLAENGDVDEPPLMDANPNAREIKQNIATLAQSIKEADHIITMALPTLGPIADNIKKQGFEQKEAATSGLRIAQELNASGKDAAAHRMTEFVANSLDATEEIINLSQKIAQQLQRPPAGAWDAAAMDSILTSAHAAEDSLNDAAIALAETVTLSLDLNGADTLEPICDYLERTNAAFVAMTPDKQAQYAAAFMAQTALLSPFAPPVAVGAADPFAKTPGGKDTIVRFGNSSKQETILFADLARQLPPALSTNPTIQHVMQPHAYVSKEAFNLVREEARPGAAAAQYDGPLMDAIPTREQIIENARAVSEKLNEFKMTTAAALGKGEFGTLAHEAEAAAQNTYTTTGEILGSAQEFNKAKQPEIAHALTNFANTMVNIGTKTQSFLKRLGNRVGPQSIENTREQAKFIMGHADEIAVDLTKATMELTKALLLGKMIGQEYHRDPETVAKIDAFVKNIKKQFADFKELPLDEKVIEGAGLFADTIFAGCLPGGLARLAGVPAPRVAGMTGAVRGEQELSKQMRHVFDTTAEIVPESEAAVRQAFAPMTTALRDAAPILQLATEAPRDVLQLPGPVPSAQKLLAAINTIKQNPDLLGLAAKPVDAVWLIAQNQEWNMKGLLHTCIGEYNTQTHKLFSGLHTQEAFEHLLTKLNISREMFKIAERPDGVWQVEFPEKGVFSGNRYRDRATVFRPDGTGISGAKAFWPKGYGPDEIRIAGIEIFSKPENLIKQQWGSLTFEGITSAGIRARVIVDERSGKIISAYPTWIF